jgi:chemotaxis protein methyltransferase CheR
VTPAKDIDISQQEFQQIADLIYKHAGIKLKDTKRQLVKSRLKKRLNTLDIDNFSTYYDRVVEDNTGQELSYLLQAISTNVTSFFREENHFDYMEQNVIPELLDRYNSTQERTYIHMWSAACSTGQEPYTMAINLLENIPNPENYRIRILGTDISGEALNSAKRAVYRMKDVEDVPRMIRNRYFETVNDGGEKKVRVKKRVRDLVKFGHLNLNANQFPFSRKFDVIFCRNVTIYFDEPVVQRLLNKFQEYMKNDAYLFMGHSESLAGIDHDLTFKKATVYQK